MGILLHVKLMVFALPERFHDVVVADLLALQPRPAPCGCCPPVYDQGQLGSCTANAIGAAIQFERRKQNLLEA